MSALVKRKLDMPEDEAVAIGERREEEEEGDVDVTGFGDDGLPGSCFPEDMRGLVASGFGLDILGAAVAVVDSAGSDSGRTPNRRVVRRRN